MLPRSVISFSFDFSDKEVTVKSMAVNTIENNPNFKIDEIHSDKIEDSIAKTNNANKVETKKPATTKTKSKDPIQKNFTVEGWPENKSRSAEDYVNYNDQTAILIPQRPFSSSIAGKFFLFGVDKILQTWAA